MTAVAITTKETVARERQSGVSQVSDQASTSGDLTDNNYGMDIIKMLH